LARRTDFIHSLILVLMSLAAAGLVGLALQQGFDYYRTPLELRPHHPDYRVFRSAGDLGHGLGVLGSSMLLLLLLYSVRKRAHFARNWGTLRSWLRYHIFLGIAGPIFITLHTAFKIKGLVAVSYWSMLSVALSGVIGRYLYQQIPRNVLGEALSLSETEDSNESLLVELSERHGLNQKSIDRLDQVALKSLENSSSILALLKLPMLNLLLARRLQEWEEKLDVPLDEQARAQIRRWVVSTRRLHLFHLVRDLFHWWHVFHKPFAIIMIAVMLVHIAVAIAMGFTWRLLPG